MDTDNFLHFGKLLLYFWRKIQNPMKWSEVAQSCPTLCDPMDCSLPGSIHEIFQARILECVAISFSRESSWLRDWTCVSWIFCIAGRTKQSFRNKVEGNTFLSKHTSREFITTGTALQETMKGVPQPKMKAC